MLRSSLCDYSNAYILVKETITAIRTAAQGQPNNGANRKVIFRKCAPFTNYISRINNTQVDDAHDIDVVMAMYNLIEYSDNYSKTSGILWQYREKAALDANGTKIADFTEENAITDLLKIKEKIIGKTGNDGKVPIMVPVIFGEYLKCL